MNPTVVGALKSKTNWLGLSIVILGYLALPDSKAAIDRYLPETVVPALNMLVGLGVVIARFFTIESLADKGTPTETPNE